RQWRRYVADRINCPLVQVESDIIVPVEQAAGKEQYSAATFRPRIQRQLERFLKTISRTPLKRDSLGFKLKQYDIKDIHVALSKLNMDRSVAPVEGVAGGTKVARKLLKVFIEKKLDNYAMLKNDPNADVLSQLSSYLHFGQISPVYIALKIKRTNSTGRDAYLEELIVRRELAINFVYYNKKYETFSSLPNWAQANLKTHQADVREYIYSLDQLEKAQTHDPYWNAAHLQMKITGKMHGYMRMYWGKKILEWTRSPRRAYQIAVYLNDKYELDGRDPNGYAGVAWCFGKHDRPWNSRSIFGSVRYMNARGLKRKFDAEAYVESIENIR
ncbi:deoxyribodipyrimidine photolyase, partial [Planctomycetota bacterium]